MTSTLIRPVTRPAAERSAGVFTKRRTTRGMAAVALAAALVSAGTATAQATPTTDAATWLSGQLTTSNHYVVGGTTDVGLTEDGLFAFKAAGSGYTTQVSNIKTWLNSTTLLERGNWGNDVVWGNADLGMKPFDAPAWAKRYDVAPEKAVEALLELLLQGDVSDKARGLILKAGRDGSADALRKALQLTVHCPEYQLA